ncbi:hypothetical protein HDU97_002304 [Phlyctochytrium planicorne]|nr:hypothetical protein HDU97_002304 [Phlyctochytrium planicorne]
MTDKENKAPMIKELVGKWKEDVVSNQPSSQKKFNLQPQRTDKSHEAVGARKKLSNNDTFKAPGIKRYRSNTDESRSNTHQRVRSPLEPIDRNLLPDAVNPHAKLSSARDRSQKVPVKQKVDSALQKSPVEDKQTNRELEEKYKVEKLRREELAIENKAYKLKIDSLEAELRDVKSLSSEASVALEAERKIVSKIREDLTANIKEGERHRLEAQAYKNLVEKKTECLNDALRQLDEIKKQTASSAYIFGRSKTISNHIQTASEPHLVAIEGIQRYDEEITNLTLQLDQEREKTADLNRKLAAALSDITELKKNALEIQALCTRVDAEKERSLSLELELSASKAKVASTLAELDSLKLEVSNNTVTDAARFAILKEELTDAIMERVAISRKLESAEEAIVLQRQQHEGEISALTLASQDAQEMLAEREKVLEELKEEVKILSELVFQNTSTTQGNKRKRVDSEVNDDFEKQSTESMRSNSQDEILVVASPSDLDGLRTEIESLRTELRDCYEVIDYLQNSGHVEENDNNASKPTAADGSKEDAIVGQSDQDRETLEIQVFALKNLLAEKESEVTELKKALEETLNENEALYRS